MTFAKNVCEAHKKEYGEFPKSIVSAPGRVHLLGEHSCWFFKDKTLSLAVDMPVFVAVSVRQDNFFNFYFVQPDERKKYDAENLKFKKEDRWANILKAVIASFLLLDFKIKGMDFTVYTEISPSAGLGIGGAIKAAAALAIKKALRLNCSDFQILKIIENANKKFLEKRNLLADNFAVLYSQPSSFILTDYSKQSFENIPFNFKDYKILITDANVPRYSIWNEEEVLEAQNALLLGDLKDTKRSAFGGWVYNTNPTEMNEELSVVSEDMRRKLLYVIFEHGNVLDALDGIKKGRFTKFARALNKSHNLLRENYPISCPEIDWIVKRVLELEPNIQDIREPVNCARVVGKTFGRCVCAFVRENDVAAYKDNFAQYSRIFGFEAHTFEVKAAKGAHFVKLKE